MHHDETDDGDDGHEDAWTFAKSECVELHERLWSIEREERVQFRNAKQEQDGGGSVCSSGGRQDQFGYSEMGLFSFVGYSSINNWVSLAPYYP